MDLASKLFKGDRVIWIIFMFLCLVSAVEVFSATSTLAYKNVNHWGPIARHASFLLAGFVVVLVLHNVPCRLFAAGIIVLPISIGMLLVTPFIGISANDAHRWLSILGFQVQPSEFAKLGCIIFVAFMLSRRRKFTENQIYWWILGGVSLTCRGFGWRWLGWRWSVLQQALELAPRSPDTGRFPDDVCRANLLAEIGQAGGHIDVVTGGVYRFLVCDSQ